MGIVSLRSVIHNFINKYETKIKERNISNNSSLIDNSASKDLINLSEDEEQFILDNINEFKKYLVEENIADSDILTKNADEIFSMSFNDGKIDDSKEGESIDDIKEEGDVLTDAEISETETTEEITPLKTDTETQENPKNIKKEDIDFYFSKYNLRSDMYEDEDVFVILDEDESGDISAEEKAKFDSYLKHINGDKDKLELEDYKEALKQIKEGTFDIDDYNSYEVPDKDKPDALDDKKAKGNMNSSQTGSSGGGGYNTSGSGGVEKTLDNMSKEELQAEKQRAQGDMQDAQKNLESIANGTSQELSQLKTQADEAYKDYKELVQEKDSAKAQQLDEITENVDNKQSEVDKQDAKVCNLECLLSQSQNMLSNAENHHREAVNLVSSNLSALEEAKNAVASASTPEEQQSAQAQLDAAQKAYDAAVSAEISAQAQVEKARADLESNQANYENAQAELEKLNSELEDLQQQKTDFEKEVASLSEDIAKAQQNYNNKKDELQTEKTQKMTEAKQLVKDKQAYINDIDSHIQKVETNKMKSDCSPMPTFDELMDIIGPLVGMNEGQIREKIKGEFPNLPFNSGLYCSDFVTYVMAKLFGEDNIPGDLLSNYNTSHCERVRHWAQRQGLYNEDISKVKPGDAVLFGEYEAGHIGIVISVNSDGTVNTIEGNGVGGFVVSRQGVRGMGYISYGSYMNQG